MTKNALLRILCPLSLFYLSLSNSLCLAQSTQPAPPLQPLPKSNSQCLLGMACASKDKEKLHTGIDYSVLPGTPVYSICDGVVHHDASKKADIWDRFLIVKHNECGGYNTLFGYYGHIDSLIGGVGTIVTKGQHIASVKEWPGQPGNTHLHFGISTRWFPSGWGYQAGDPVSNGWLSPGLLLRIGINPDTKSRPPGEDGSLPNSQIQKNRLLELSPTGKMSISTNRQINYSRSAGEHKNAGAFAVLRGDGSVVTWGNPKYGGDSSSVSGKLSSGVLQIYSTISAFAALKYDGSVVSWGNSAFGGDSRSVADQLRSGVVQVYSSRSAFAALKSDGSVVTWGSDYDGGNSSVVANELRSSVKQIFSTNSAFAALKENGSVITWGSENWGGDSRDVKSNLRSGIKTIMSNGSAFAAIRSDGSLVVWGLGLKDEPGFSWKVSYRDVADRLRSGVVDVYAADQSFAVLKSDGSVVTFGGLSTDSGGDSSSISSLLQSDVESIYSTSGAYAALKRNGSVNTWGTWFAGGDSRDVATQLRSGVIKLFSTSRAFAALKADGSVVTWGFAEWGGDSRGVADQLRSGVVKIAATDYAFAALKADGSIVTWGSDTQGGMRLESFTGAGAGFREIFSTGSAFAALHSNGTVVTWGDMVNGGDSKRVSNQLSNVVGFANPFTDDRLIYEATSATNLPRSRNSSANSRNRTVILGTGTWDMESNRQRVCNDECDIWWKLVDDRVQYLVPQNGASLARINNTDFNRIDIKFLRGLSYKSDHIPSSLLAPGAIVGIRTNNGNFGKIMIVSYRDLHDLNFADAEWLTSRSRSYILNDEPNRSNAHLEVDWVLYN